MAAAMDSGGRRGRASRESGLQRLYLDRVRDSRNGIMTGFNLPPRRTFQRVPDWVDPEEALSRRDTPHLSYQLDHSRWRQDLEI